MLPSVPGKGSAPVMSSKYEVGDKIRYTVSSINNSALDTIFYPLTSTWIADIIWAMQDTYNSTSETWSTPNEVMIYAYNSTENFSFKYGDYYYWSTNDILATLNFSATNHTIINKSYSTLFSHGVFQYTTPNPYVKDSPH